MGDERHTRPGNDPATVHGRFAAWAVAAPDRVAVTDGRRTLTYGELDAEAGGVAHRLRAAGIAPGGRVGVCLRRSADLIVALMGVLKAGCGYVPLDPDHPRRHREFVLADSEVPVVLAGPGLADDLRGDDRAVIVVDGTEPAAPCEEAGGDLAYVIYTSGSTGTPKGVEVTHANVLALFDAAAGPIGIEETDVWSMFHSTSFDFSVWEMWGALLYGGRLVVVPSAATRSMEDLVRLLRDERVTMLSQVPSVFGHLTEAYERLGRPGLAVRTVVFGGESFDRAAAARFLHAYRGPAPDLVNMYGITETTVHVTYHRVTAADLADDGETIPIGRPLPHLRVHLLDDVARPVPDDAIGEIWVSGTGLARGYLGRPELTERRYRTIEVDGAKVRAYRSGDLARRRPDGELVYAGRADRQVKIRGLRIEPGQIEAAARDCPGVAEAAVTVHEPFAGGRRLVAYLVPVAAGRPFDVEDVRARLGARLPAYMVPAQYVVLDRMPLSASGKLDHAALPTPPAADAASAARPVSDAERILTGAWAEVLRHDPAMVGTDDNFFALGGDSLNAIEVVVAAAEHGLTVTLDQIFRHQTVAELAAAAALEATAAPAASAGPAPFALLTDEDRARVPAGTADAYPMTMLQQGMIAQTVRHADAVLYHDVLVLRVGHPLNATALGAAFADLVAAHPVLRTTFDHTGFSEPLQLVAERAVARMAVVDLRALAPEDQGAAVEGWIAAEKRRPIGWRAAPLVRLTVFNVGDRAFRIGMGFNHAVLDGFSLVTMLADWLRRYVARLDGTAPPRERADTFFADHVMRERAAIAAPDVRAWWLAKLAGPAPASLPKPAAVTSHEPGRHIVEVDAAVYHRLRELARAEGVSIKHLALAAHLWTLGRLSGARSVITGMVANGRPESVEALRTLGLFLNTVPVRVDLPDGSWRELVRAAFAGELELLPFRRYPYARLARDLGRPQLVETTFNYVHYREYAALADEGIEIGYDYFYERAEFPYSLYVNLDPAGESLSLDLHYDRARLTDTQATRAAELCHEALRAIATEPDAACPSPEDRPAEAVGHGLAAVLGVDPALVTAVTPLTPTQRDLYLHQLRWPESTAYCLAFVAELGTGIDVGDWRRAVTEVTAAEESLRTRLADGEDDGLARMCVVDEPGGPVELVDFAAPDTPLSTMPEVVAAVRRPYDLAGGELVRQLLVRDHAGGYHAVIGAHHVALDGVSAAILFRRYRAAYDALREGRRPAAPHARFRDHAQRAAASVDTAAALAHWRDVASAVEPPSVLPPADVSGGRSAEHAVLAGAELSELRRWCARAGVRLPNLILAAYGLVLGRLFDATADFVIDHVVAARPPAHRETVGCFYQVLPVVVPTREAMRRTEFVEHFQTYRDAHAGHDVSVLAQRSLFPAQQVRFAYNFYTFTRPEEPDGPRRIRVHDEEPDDEAHLIVDDLGDRVELSFRYPADRVARLAVPTRVRLAARQLVRDGDVGSVSVLPDGERDSVVGRPNVAGVVLPDTGRALHELIEERVSRWPDAVAVRFGERTVTYRELMDRSGRLAARLRTLGVGPEHRVAVALERSVELVTSLLAVLRAGAAYVPLDPGYPEDRLRHMLADSGATALVATPAMTRMLPVPPGTAHCDPHDVVGHGPLAGPACPGAAGLAYVIYTSGSTGRPKGAMTQHDAIVNRLVWMQRQFPLGPDDRVLQKTPYSFDVSVWEFFWPLLTGACLVVAEPDGHRDPLYLADLIESAGVSTVHFVPSMLRHFLEALDPGRCPSLRRIVCSGEALSAPLRDRCRALLPLAQLYNLYGPTEAAVDVTWWDCTDDDGPVVPIGRPVANTQVYVLDRRLRPVPRGVAGELCVGGIQVGRGYLGRPSLTAERFVPDPYGDRPGGRLYRTGDRVRWRSDGALEYLGRYDDQIKLRGFRIEPGEVVAALCELPEISDAAVVRMPGLGGTDQLVAYLVPVAGAGPDWATVRAHLRDRLPEHAVPSAHVVLDALPLGPSGKPDRAALPAPAAVVATGAPTPGPVTQVERGIMKVWCDVLGVEGFGLDDSFFDIGGDSLLLLQTLGRLRTTVDGTGDLSAVDLFSHPTVRSLAGRIGREPEAASAKERARGRRRGALAAQRGRRGARRDAD
jgi:amino acid adenylation domain-containing protein